MLLTLGCCTETTQFSCFSDADGKEPRRGEKGKEDLLHAASSQSSSYFEIPTKEGHMANNGIHEIPTKDTEGNVAHTSTGKSHVPFLHWKTPVLVIILGISRIPTGFYLDALFNHKVKLLQMLILMSAPQLKVTPPSR